MTVLKCPNPSYSWFCSSLKATEFRASFGHLSNQIIVQPLIIDGKDLHLFLSLLPTGENEITRCRFYFMSYMKRRCIFSFVSWSPLSFTMILNSLYISSRSSKAIRFGTSPLLMMLFMSSKKLSFFMLLSDRISTVEMFLEPVCLRSFLISSFHEASL